MSMKRGSVRKCHRVFGRNSSAVLIGKKRRKEGNTRLLSKDCIMSSTFSKVFEEKFDQSRQPCVDFMAPERVEGMNEERIRQFFDGRYVVDATSIEPAILNKCKSELRRGLPCSMAIRSVLKIKTVETPLVMVQLMRDPDGNALAGMGSFEYQNSSILVDPSNFEVYYEIEKMHYEHSGGQKGYPFEYGCTPATDVPYNVHVSVAMMDRP